MGGETVIKNKLRQAALECGHWSECYEPRFGSGTGIPDLHILVGKLVPVEVKEGTINDSGKIVVDKVRPAQISWHERFARAGGHSVLYIGVGSMGVLIPSVRFESLRHWRDGWRIEECKLVVENWKMIDMQLFLS